ncbi:MAG: sulfurtransferase TusA family protein [Pseudomonadota bacterium]
MAQEELDTRGLLCPLPVIRVQEAVSCRVAGTRLRVRASDPGAAHDIPAWCRVHGHSILWCESSDDGVELELEIGRE